MRRLNDKVVIIDIVITVILAIVVGIGIGIVLSKRPKTYTGELTTENYTKYIDVNCGLRNVTPSKDFTCDYRLDVSAKPDCKIYDLEITVEVNSEGSDFGSYTLKAVEISPENPCVQTGDVNYSLEGYPAISWSPHITVKVISVSGRYEYIDRGNNI